MLPPILLDPRSGHRDRTAEARTRRNAATVAGVTEGQSGWQRKRSETDRGDCRRNDLVFRSRSVSSDEQGCYPQDQTKTKPLILGKAAENPEYGREFGCHGHHQTTNH